MGAINTLAQTGTGNRKKLKQIVYGSGSDVLDKTSVSNKARKKLITSSLIGHLIKIAEVEQDGKMQKALWNTYHCYNRIVTVNGRSYGQYCKNRFCTVCSGNRKADLINKYFPVLKKWDSAQFVTLTVKSPTANNLNRFVKKVDQGLKIVLNRLKQRHKRGKSIKCLGIRAIECNFNPATKTYNPHVHLIVQNRETANLIAREWLKLWTKKYAHYNRQHIQPVRNKEGALIELIKYNTKIFTEPDPRKKKKKGQSKLYVRALYNIIQSMKGIRIFERFGFNLPTKDRKIRKETEVERVESWEYDIVKLDWVNQEVKKLTNYVPDDLLVELLRNGVDSETQ